MDDQVSRVAPVIVELPAEIDVTNSGQVYDRLVAALTPGVESVIADMTSTSFCDSSGVRMIVRALESAAARGVRLRLAVPPEGSVRRVLQLTGVGSLVAIYPSLEEAINAA
jgi:anti-sigma B factor antagonist